jgi:hypothetical protein
MDGTLGKAVARNDTFHFRQKGLQNQPIREGRIFQSGVFIPTHPNIGIFRSYHLEYSDTHQNIELKHGWAGLVLG